MPFGRGRPVAQEGDLQPCDAAALDPEVGVAPRPPFRAAHVAVGDVHAADETHAAVDDHDLAVVAVIDLAGEARELHVQEGVHLDPFAAHPLEERFADAAASHVVVEDPHVHPLPGLFHECVAQAPPRFVIAEDVVLQVDVVPGPGDLAEQSLHFAAPVGVGSDAAAVCLNR